MAIAISFGNIGEAMEFVGKGQGGFGEHGLFFGVEGEFSLVGASDGAGGSDDVTGVSPGFEILGGEEDACEREGGEREVRKRGRNGTVDGEFSQVSTECRLDARRNASHCIHNRR